MLCSLVVCIVGDRLCCFLFGLWWLVVTCVGWCLLWCFCLLLVLFWCLHSGLVYLICLFDICVYCGEWVGFGKLGTWLVLWLGIVLFVCVLAFLVGCFILMLCLPV